MNNEYLEAYVEDHRDVFDFESATRLGAIMESHYRSRIFLNKRKLEARGEVTSILGAITIGYLKFLFNMIKNFVLYIIQAIKFFIADSGILQGIVKGMMGLFGESGNDKLMRQKVKLVSPDQLRNEFARITTIAHDNTRNMFNYFTNLEQLINSSKSLVARLLKKKSRTEEVNDLDLFYALLPKDISNGEEDKFTVEFANKYAINQNDAKRYLGDCQYRFKKYLDNINPKKLNLKPSVEIAHKVDAADILNAYKDVLSEINLEYYAPFMQYLQNINGLTNSVQARLAERMADDKLYGDTMTTSYKEIASLFYFYCDGLFSKVVLSVDYMVKDMQIIRDTIMEQIANISKAL